MSEGGKRKLEEVLTKVVSDLAKATVDTANQVPIDTLEELRLIKKSVDVLSSKTDTLLTKSQERTAASATQHIALLTQLTTLTTAVNKSSKVSRLQWAITNTNFGIFEYWNDKSNRTIHYKLKSDTIAREILMMFMRGFGYFIEGFVFTEAQRNNYHQLSAADVTTARTAFHTALTIHIHTLTGVKPSVQSQASDPNKFAIHYE